MFSGILWSGFFSSIQQFFYYFSSELKDTKAIFFFIGPRVLATPKSDVLVQRNWYMNMVHSLIIFCSCFFKRMVEMGVPMSWKSGNVLCVYPLCAWHQVGLELCSQWIHFSQYINCLTPKHIHLYYAYTHLLVTKYEEFISFWKFIHCMLPWEGFTSMCEC